MNDDKNVKSNNDEVKTPVDDEKDSDVKVAPSSEPDDDEKDSDVKVAPTTALDDDEKVAPNSTSTVINNNTQNYNSITVNTAELVQAQPSNTSSIFGFVRNMFTSVVSTFFTGGLFNSPVMRGVQSLLGQRFGFNVSQPQQSLFGRFVPTPIQQIFNFNQTSYSQTYSTTRTLAGSDNKEVWLSNETEEVTINATETTGTNILAGNNKDNQIFGGSGINDMWGGGGKTNDFLFGGTGKNTFWYGKGEGIDLVENTKTGDTINLYNITLGDISNVEITDSSISAVIGDSEGIAVNTSDNISPTFKLADGESYNYNRSSAEWQKA